MVQAQEHTVRDMVGYLQETLDELDGAIAELQAQRAKIATRLIVLRAAQDPSLDRAGADLEDRIRENRPYETAMNANELILEAKQRFTK